MSPFSYAFLSFYPGFLHFLVASSLFTIILTFTNTLTFIAPSSLFTTMFSKVALVALAAGAQVSFAAPVTQEQRSIPAILRGATSLLTGDLLNNKYVSESIL